LRAAAKSCGQFRWTGSSRSERPTDQRSGTDAAGAPALSQAEPFFRDDRAENKREPEDRGPRLPHSYAGFGAVMASVLPPPADPGLGRVGVHIAVGQPVSGPLALVVVARSRFR